MSHTVPLAQLMDSKITALRQWSKGRAREAASRSATTATTTGSRPSRRMSEMN
jgi:hypothetical protein